MKTPILIIIFCIFSTFIKSENNKPLPYRIATVEKIVQQLFVANGNFRIKKPIVEMRMTQQQVAAYMPDKNLVIIEDKAYQICQSMGKDSLDALAFLLGHELTHAYQHAKTKTGFISNFLSYDKAKNADTHKEKEADIQGAFNAYLAGYNIRENIPTILEKIYIAYQLKGKVLQGYPTFEERLNVAKEVEKKVNDLIQIYESANVMTALGQYTFSQLCYENILESYQNREIYNNLGVTAALAATELASTNEDKWQYPYEIDWQTRLSRKKPRSYNTTSDDDKKERILLLKKAQSYFETAYKMDKNYTVAAINAICVLAQMGDIAEVEKRYKKLKTRDNLQKNYAKIAYAITLCHNSAKIQEAQVLLEALKSNPQKNIAQMAENNLAILNQKQLDFESKNCEIAFENTNIDDVQLYKLSNIGKVLPINTAKNAQLIIKKHANSSVIQAKMKNGYYFAFQRINKQVNTEGVAKGNIISTNMGFISICDDLHVAFRYDKDNKLVEWVKYYGN